MGIVHLGLAVPGEKLAVVLKTPIRLLGPVNSGGARAQDEPQAIVLYLLPNFGDSIGETVLLQPELHETRVLAPPMRRHFDRLRQIDPAEKARNVAARPLPVIQTSSVRSERGPQGTDPRPQR